MDAVFDSAPSMLPRTRQSGAFVRLNTAVEAVLEGQRDQLPLWLPVALGVGIAAWFVLPAQPSWLAWIAAMAGLGSGALLLPRLGRLRKAILIAALMSAIGCGNAWLRAERVAAPVLARPVIASFTGTIADIDVLASKDALRLTLRPADDSGLPPVVRVTVDAANAPAGLAVADVITLRARLVGPPTATVPGGYDFSRAAWFMGLGATGKALGPVVRVNGDSLHAPGFRDRLSAHIKSQVEGSAGGIAAAFATGDRGGIAKEDEDAMRASGLTHLLSISGLHVTAVVAAAMFLTLRLLALSSRLALRLPLTVVAAGAGAIAGIGYTLLTGAEIPTIRSCVAAVLIVIGSTMGRQAFTLRLVSGGALVVLLAWPDALVGPSFQLSFAAITAVIALHEWAPMQHLVAKRDEGRLRRIGREMLSLLLTGLAVEIALAPIALYHFHRQGLYGALANIVAIPLTTFVTMPLEALAILFDAVGIGAPFWWATSLSLDLLLAIARHVAAWPGALATLASVPLAAFAAMIGGGLWLLLWRGSFRRWGFAPFAIGTFWAFVTPSPDLLVTSDGMHLAVRGDEGQLATLRPRAGDYVRAALAERAGDLGDLADLDALAGADCSDDVCRVTLHRDGRAWHILATRSRYMLPIDSFAAECAAADIVISDRRLPGTCRPRWLKADRPLLDRTGGLAIAFASHAVETVNQPGDAHPWVLAQRFNGGAAAPRAYPVRAPDWRHRLAPDTAHSPDRGESAARRGGNI